MSGALRSFLAGNPGPFTLKGSRPHVVGAERPAVIDPGPDLADHVEVLTGALSGASRVTVLLTHGHADHAGAVVPLLEALARHGFAVSVAGSGHPSARPLSDGEAVGTDAGELVAVATPGHTEDHLAFHWPAARALFAGDLLLGAGDTTWVGGYPGCVADYLASLERLRSMDLAVIHPAHGPDLTRPTEAIERFERHRQGRIEQVRAVLAAHPDASPEALLDPVYGSGVPSGLRHAAVASLRALMEYVKEPSRE